ncbi:hypothetical protein [Algoriphagus namhaensis]
MRITRSWREQKVMLKRRFTHLMDRDFDFEEGQRETMMQRLALKLQKSREELDTLFAELQRY